MEEKLNKQNLISMTIIFTTVYEYQNVLQDSVGVKANGVLRS